MTPYQIKNSLYLLAFLFFYMWIFLSPMDIHIKALYIGGITFALASLHEDKEEESG